jgi:glycosyltransferase involved in cell wall biosynthesis
LKLFQERNLFLRGIIPRLGFDTATVYYDRAERFAGESKYPLSKMLGLAIDGITSFSTTPLRWVSYFGAITCAMSLIVSLWVLVVRLTGHGVPGWASILLPLLLLGGGQIICLGVIGSYVGRLYQEVKGRPRYIIDQVAQDSETP